MINFSRDGGVHQKPVRHDIPLPESHSVKGLFDYYRDLAITHLLHSNSHLSDPLFMGQPCGKKLVHGRSGTQFRSEVL